MKNFKISTGLLILIISILKFNHLIASPDSSLPPSSLRKSLNFDQTNFKNSLKISIFKKNNHQENLKLINFNNLISLSNPSHLKSNFQINHPNNQKETLKDFGLSLANQFLNHLYPNISFELTSSYFSNHNSIFHAYFIQTTNHKAKIFNSLANLNIDLDPKSKNFGHIISHSDSFNPNLNLNSSNFQISNNFNQISSFLKPKTSSDHCSILHEKFQKALESFKSTISINQQQQRQHFFNLFSDQSSDLVNHFTQDELLQIAECDTLSTHSNPSSQSSIVDPRIALISFLTIASDHSTESHLRSKSLDELINSIYIIQKPNSLGNSNSDNLLELYNVPGSLSALDPSSDHSTQPTIAELAWLNVNQDDSNSDSSQLKMVWRFEYRSQSNWYESYVDASQPDLVPMVVDWIKDFRPTDDTSFTMEQHQFIQSSLKERLKSFSPVNQSSVDKPQSNLPPLPHGSTSNFRPASYRVFPWSVNDPTEGHRKLIESPSDSIASPLGWHTIPPTHPHSDQLDLVGLPVGWSQLVSRHGLRAFDTRGNNVYAQENWEGLHNWEANYRPNGTDQLKFDFPLGWNKTHGPEETHINPQRYIDSAVSELFYTCNEFHDLTYRYGFDEESGNFQQHNFGRGGKGGDGVIANAQDGSGYNNANFATPPDGRHGQMRMYVWNGPEPWRDGDLEAGIVIHEYSHGVSTRLTGGPANSACLGWGEAGGMGEGWGDMFATLIRMHKAKPVDFTMGEWASGAKGGIRKYKYSLNNMTNPETYTTLDKPGYWGVHAIGEVWAEMLFTVAEELISKHGYEPNLFPPTDQEDPNKFYKISDSTGKMVPKKGNTLFFQLVIDGMKLQPCRPGFFDARDAILQADSILTGGENHCEIWKGFSKRGLGPNASLKGNTPWGGGIRTDDFSIPDDVCLD
ncbi:hypothetical protein O181_086534 [Austropuccinia psidii MF-1]|uniref:Extracellular metalloproteinase n=1 Tax=Austropuccinia psidii MF-1 TaxID=1389203 RepID=A0A9Q3INE3_9BASI|nr:hypothetical protein [Austropuccinia psidii MF-1]